MKRLKGILVCTGRIARYTATGLSMILLIVVLLAWGHGYFFGDRLMLRRESRDANGWRNRVLTVACVRGHIGLLYQSALADVAQAQAQGYAPGIQWVARYRGQELEAISDWHAQLARNWFFSAERIWHVQHLGVVLARVEGGENLVGIGSTRPLPAKTWELFIACPCWIAAILFSVLPAQRSYARLRRRRKRHLERAGVCPDCGYDLRATPDANGPRFARCPECGRATSPEFVTGTEIQQRVE